MENRYDTYILEMYQSNGIHIETDASNICRSMRCDELRYKKLRKNQKGYLDYFRINDVFRGNEQGKVSSQTLSMYQRADRDKKDALSTDGADPFIDNADAPFLMLIQIRLYRKTFSYIKNKYQEETEPDVEAFLRMMEKSINRKVERVFTAVESGSPVFKTFRSSTTGDFCVVIRTACTDLINRIADKLQTCTILASVYMTVWKRKASPAEDVVYVSIPEKTRFINKGSSALGISAAKKYERNQKLLERIMQLNSYREDFAQENRSFQDLFYATKELYRNYAATAWEKDTEINWKIWYHDMDILCNCIIEHMNAYQKIASNNDDRQRKFRLRLLQSWRQSILAIDRYTHLVHNVNDEDYHIFSFESQTQIDAEKIMVAYREAMRVYYRGYDRESARKYNATTQIEPIIYPALIKEKIEVTTLFANITASSQPCTKVCVCTVPSFENFGRLYDFLPLLMHETAHSIRIMDRSKRNRFLMHYTLKHVFLEVIRQLLQEPSDVNRYEDMGAATGNLLNAFLNIAESEIITFAEKNQNIDLDKNAGFEQAADALALYLQELFPQETNVTKDFEKARDRLLEIFITEFRQNGMLEDSQIPDHTDILNDLQTLKNSSLIEKNGENLLKAILKEKNEKMMDSFFNEKEDNTALLTTKDFNLSAKAFDKRIYDIREALRNPQTISAANEYIFFVTKLYRIYKLYRTAKIDYSNPEKTRKAFLQKVFDNYIINRCKSADSLQDPETMYFLNFMGLLGEDATVFYKQCKKAFDKLSFQAIYDCKKFRTRIYRETCADVMMTQSLNLTAFGYCRQIFRAISDTAQTYSFDRYESLDFVRFRTVAALLLLIDKKSTKVKKESYGEDEYKINGKRLIEEGQCYCEHYLKYIRKIICEENEEVTEEQINFALGDINEQLRILIKDYTFSFNKRTPLYALAHGKQENLPTEVQTYWEKHKGLKKIFPKYRQHFWRLECFSIGLHNILPDGGIIVEKDLLDHMLELWENVKNPSSSCGCVWENNLWPCMLKSKEKVGNYYNDPESVFTVSNQEKLEDTIEFIQNFYYHNRVDMACYEEQVNGESTKENIKKSNDPLCGKPL